MPRARFRSSGGVSIVNAIGSGGYGGAAGVNLWLEARASEEPGVYGGSSRWPGGGGSLPGELVEAVARAAEKVGGFRLEGLWLEVDSDIPPGRGLKSSASLLTAALGAALRVKGARPAPELLAVEASRLSLKLGLSATGALDDHAASIIDAPVVTFNPGFRIERVLPRGGCGLTVLIAYGDEVNQIYSLDPRPFKALRHLYSAAASLALEGLWVEAARVNGLASAAALGLEQLALKALRMGAEAAGITGKGPAFFALVPGGVGAVKGLLLSHGFTRVLESRFRWCP